jgi:PBP1b-binding outer membrane lipoprotein LpoB
MKTFLILFISIVICLGCSLVDNPTEVKPHEKIEIKKSKVNPCDTIPVSLNCIGRTDTIMENKSVKYITKNNFIQLKVTIGGIDTLLSDSINCCSQAIPIFRLSKDNFIFLEKGHGF